jgi:flagellar biosynthesis chaperone FliJ
MKRFAWSLQRLLDVTAQREKLARAEVLAISRQVAAARQEIARRRATGRMLLAERAQLQLAQRLASEDAFAAAMTVGERLLAGLAQRLEELQKARHEASARLMKVRQSRQTLQRLRAEALRKYMAEQARQEQKQLDEAAQTAFNRRRAAAASGSRT